MSYCPRQGRHIKEPECHAHVLGAASGADLRLCRSACAAGLALMTGTRFGRRRSETALRAEASSATSGAQPARVSTRARSRPAIVPPAPAQMTPIGPERAPSPEHPQSPESLPLPATDFLPPLLAYILPRFPGAKHQGVRFLTMLAKDRGFCGDKEDFIKACRAAGLTVITRPLVALAIDDKARALAGLKEGK